MKKKIDCAEYNILAKQEDDLVLILVNGEKFITIEEFDVSELDDEKLIDFISKEYEVWAFSEPHVFDKFKFMKDGSTCR